MPKPQALTPAQQLAQEYDHGHEADFEPVVTYTPDLQVAPATPPRDPETGRFLPSHSPEPDEPPKPPERSPHSPRLLRMAERLGVARDRATELTPDALEELVDTLQDRILSERPQQHVWHDPREDAPENRPQAEEEFNIPGLVEADWQEGLVKPLKQAFTQQQKQIKAMQKQLADFQQRDHAREGETNAERIDRIINGWNDPRFGRGSIHELASDSSAALARQAVVAAAIRLAGQGATPDRVISRLKEASEKLYGTTKPAPRTNGRNGYTGPGPEESDEVRRWNDSGLMRPTSRGGAKEPDQRARAIRAVEEKYREMAASGVEEEHEDDDLP